MISVRQCVRAANAFPSAPNGNVCSRSQYSLVASDRRGAFSGRRSPPMTTRYDILGDLADAAIPALSNMGCGGRIFEYGISPLEGWAFVISWSESQITNGT